MQTTFSKRTYDTPRVLIEKYAVNEYVATCGDTITEIPEQTVHCIATCETTVFAQGNCSTVANVVTSSGGPRYYKNENGAATDLYNGVLGDKKPKSDVPSSNRQTSEYWYEVANGVEYVVWIEENHYHANTYETIQSEVEKS